MDPNTEERGRKRSRSTTKAHDDGKAQLSNIDALSLASVSEPISPPAKKQREDEVLQANVPASTTHTDHAGKYVIASPFQLTHVTALPNSTNVDALKLSDLVGDPLIRDCWAFNYLFDVDFLMNNLDEDVRDHINMFLVHGSWRREDSNRVGMEAATARYKRVKTITAYMPEAFGTHHSKMFILIRHDDYAQVIILTANLLPRDWSMCQAVWRSPLLPLLSKKSTPIPGGNVRFGSGERFKFDLLSYLKTYGSKLRDLISTIDLYDFDQIRAAFIASTPGRQNLRTTDQENETVWGWPGLKQVLSRIPAKTQKPCVVSQVSSIATLGVKDTWLSNTFFKALRIQASPTTPVFTEPQTPSFHIIFPTADEIRRSIDGYGCGGSIHMKTQSAQNVKQLKYLHSLLCHWAGDQLQLESPSTSGNHRLREAGRRRTGPHIKTYFRFSDDKMETIDWAMMSSSNLSKQAWGAEATSNGEVRICSYEVGVLIWPGLWEGENCEAIMVPTFKADTPPVDSSKDDETKGKIVVGIRMPYDLPLVPYSHSETPWCATAPDPVPDWLGRTWPGY